MISPTVLNTPHGTQDIPTFITISPHGTEHPHGTQDIPHGTEHPPRYCTHIIQGGLVRISEMDLTKFTLYKRCALPVRICIPGENVHSRWVTSPFPVRQLPIPGEDVHSRWVTSPFPVRMCISGESHRNSWWGWLFHCDSSSPGMHIFTGNGDVIQVYFQPVGVSLVYLFNLNPVWEFP